MWYHYVGIGGAGMSALAAIMLAKGHKVTGSDIAENAVVEHLRTLGAEITIGHKKENVKNPDVVVYSTAIKIDNPERVYARENGIKEMHRSENLAEILNNGYGIAIAGSHGKTTTSALVSYMLIRAGADPTAVIAGYVPQLDGNCRIGLSDIVVAESDESDGSFLRYYPEIGSVSSVDPDHLENYQLSVEKLQQAYAEFVSNIKQLALLCADDPQTESLAKFANCKVLTYGVKAGDLQAYDIKEGEVTSFKVAMKGQELGQYQIKLAGKHNVANALIAIGIAQELNLDPNLVKAALSEFVGTGRRFEKRYEEKGILVIDDYGHHPTEIKATVDAARHRYPDKEIWLAFQPHRYNRTKILWQDFPKALASADKTLVLGIYAPPPEEPIEGINSQNLAREVEKLGKTAYYAKTLEEGAKILVEKVPEGALILTMGAGSVTKLPDLWYKLLTEDSQSVSHSERTLGND